MTITASDRNDNLGQQLAINRHDIFGELAAELAKHGIGEHLIPHYLGTFSGLSTGAVDTVEFIHAFFSDPVGFVQGVAQIIDAITNLDEIIARLPDAIERQQELANPYDPDTDSTQYETFRLGWYRGYVTWLVIESLVPAGEAARALKSSNRMQSLAQSLDRGGRISSAARMIRKTGARAAAPVRITGQQFSAGLSKTAGLAREGAENTLARVRSAMAQRRVAQELPDVDARTINRLSPEQQKRLGRVIALTGDDGVRVVNRLDANGVESLLDLPPAQRARTVSRMADVDEARLADLAGQHADVVGAIAREGDVARLLNTFDEAAQVSRTSSSVVVRGQRGGVDLDFTYPRDGEGFLVSRSSANSIDEIRSASSQRIGRTFAEEDWARSIVRDRPNQEIVFAARGSDPGIDMILKDTQTGEFIVSEVKFTRSSETIGAGKFSSTRTLDGGRTVRQMSDRWIENAFNEEILQKGINVPDELELAIRNRNYRKEALIFQDAKPGSTITRGISEPPLELDSVSVVRTDGVTK